jgi:predicted phosphodiesterase
MRLLLTADLHFHIHWFHWLIQQAPDFDLVCIAGDLLDMFRSETRMEQAREIRTSSGNLPILFLSLFAPAIMIMLADSFRMIGPPCTNGSLTLELTGTS